MGVNTEIIFNGGNILQFEGVGKRDVSDSYSDLILNK